MTDPDLKELADMLPKNTDDLKPWHPLMGFSWEVNRLMSAQLFTGIADVRARESINEEKEG